MDKDGKFKLREDPNRMFAQQCIEKLSEPISIPDNPALKDGQLIHSSKGNLVALLYGDSEAKSIARIAKRNVERRGRERLNKLIRRELHEHKMAAEKDSTSAKSGDSAKPGQGSPLSRHYIELGRNLSAQKPPRPTESASVISVTPFKSMDDLSLSQLSLHQLRRQRLLSG